MNSNKITIPENELIKAKEYGFNEMTRISNEHAGNSFMITQGMLNVLSTIYEMGFKSGFMESQLSNITNKPE